MNGKTLKTRMPKRQKPQRLALSAKALRPSTLKPYNPAAPKRGPFATAHAAALTTSGFIASLGCQDGAGRVSEFIELSFLSLEFRMCRCFRHHGWDSCALREGGAGGLKAKVVQAFGLRDEGLRRTLSAKVSQVAKMLPRAFRLRTI